ncbi:MerR family transcriptional regulator [Solicola gregarius]|uniref:MerR family transcriptional regulator n=1 Tax=Solicola gregarius TaxID=2908642 RepID=A0AA46YM99_9ACTN|nr:MerR family transcriptional regulator [Solicola gregarius]UYM05578.1 MerR family transcriptional regulator [Solicola gregarius]
MRIGRLASRTGVSRRLLRYYEEQGLLRPTRLTNGYREYAESDVDDVYRIRYLLAAGLPTTVIGEILDCVEDRDDGIVASPCPGMVTHLSRERARIDDKIARLEDSRRALDGLLVTVAEAPAR